MPPLDWYAVTGAFTGAGAGLIVAYLLIRLTIPMLIRSWDTERAQGREEAREARREFLAALTRIMNGVEEEGRAARASAEAARAATERTYQEMRAWQASRNRTGTLQREQDSF